MKPVFWKLSHGFTHFTYPEFLESIEDKLAYIHKDTKAKGQSPTTQGHDFISAEIGNYVLELLVTDYRDRTPR